MANLSTGITHTATYAVDRRLTVPELFPEDPNTSRMPEVLATGFLVALMERACVEAMAPHLAEGEASLGIGVELKHLAPTLPGMTVTIEVRCTAVDGRRSSWEIEARDELATIGQARHERAVVDVARFTGRLEEMRGKLGRG